MGGRVGLAKLRRELTEGLNVTAIKATESGEEQDLRVVCLEMCYI